MRQGWEQVITWQKLSGTLLNTFTTAKSILNSECVQALPSGFFSNVGDRTKITVHGAISNIVTTPGTITFQVMFGAVIVFTTGAIQLNATAHTTLPFRLTIDLRCNSIGAGTAATLIGFAEVAGVMFTKTAAQTDGANTETIIQVPVTAPAAGTGFDSTVAQTLDLFAGFSISNAGNGVQVHTFDVESLN